MVLDCAATTTAIQTTIWCRPDRRFQTTGVHWSMTIISTYRKCWQRVTSTPVFTFYALITYTNIHRSNLVELCYPNRQYMRLSVRPSRNVRICTVGKRLHLDALIFAYMQVDKKRSSANSHPKHQRSWPSLSRSKIRIEYILIWYVIISKSLPLTIHRESHMAFRWAYLHLTLTNPTDHPR